ncbi:MAG: hypothetical protein R6V85_14905 [Polyangia bacterium]
MLRFYSKSFVCAGLICLGSAFGCADSASTEDDDDTDTGTGSDSGGDTDVDGDSDSDSDSDTDTDSDGDTDSDSDSDGDTDSATEGYDCENPIVIPNEPALFEMDDNWSHFQTDTFDSTLPNCSDSGGTTAWFELSVPAGHTLDVEKTNGATVGINVVEGCDAEQCLASDVNRLVWPNIGDQDALWMVAVETDFAISQAAMEISFDRYEKHGETCLDGVPLDGPYPHSESLTAADYELDEMPSGCGQSYYYGEDVWFDVPVPPATALTFEAAGDTYYGYLLGYSLDCASCELGTDSYTATSFEYTNTGEETVHVHAFVQNYQADTGQYTGTATLTPLPDGDTCGGAIDVDESALPASWSDDNPLFNHTCPSGVCPGTSGPDVWHEIDVPAGDVLTATRPAGPDAFFAIVDSCAATDALFFSAEPQLAVWQNTAETARTVLLVAGAVGASAIDTLEIEIDVYTPAEGDFCGSAIPVFAGDTTLFDGLWAEIGDGFWGGDGCAEAAGPEAWYAVEVPSGEKLTATESSASDTTLHVLADCEAGACAASSAGEVVDHLNISPADELVYVAVEAADADPVADGWEVSFSWQISVEGDLCVDPIEIPEAESAWSGSWADYMDSQTLETADGCGWAAGRDVWLDVTTGAGQRLIAEQISAIPTEIQLVEGCADGDGCLSHGEDEAIWYNDSAVSAPAHLAVEAISSAVVGGPVDLAFYRESIPAGDACTTAFDVDETGLPALVEADLWNHGPAWPSSWCAPAEGADAWWVVDVPPGNVVFLEETSSTDSAVYLAADCPATGCVASADEPERINWYNGADSTVPVWAVVKAVSAWDNGASVSAVIDVGPAAQGDFCSTAIDLSDETMPHDWSDDLGDYTDGFVGLAANGCAETTGSEVWFRLEVPAGDWLTASDGSSTPVTIQLAESCASSQCLDNSAGGSLFWENDSGESVTVHVAVEGDGVSDGPLELTFDVIDAPPTLFGPDAYGYWGATDDDVSVCPDISQDGTQIEMYWGSVVQVSMGTEFQLYGQLYSDAYVAWDGLVSFGQANSYSGGWYQIPTGDPYIDMPFIAPYWSEMEPEYSTDGGVFHHSWDEGGQTLFEVQWQVPAYGGASSDYDIRMVLEGDTGKIHFCYVDTDTGDAYYNDGGYATSGIQQDSSQGLQYSYQQAILTEGLHTWFVSPD